MKNATIFYLRKLNKIKFFFFTITHTGLREHFRRGCFGVKRTNKPFSRVPFYLTLEQTINADVGRKLTGISHITNSIGLGLIWFFIVGSPNLHLRSYYFLFFRRWSINHGLRCTFLNLSRNGKVWTQTDPKMTNDLVHKKIKGSSVYINTFIAAIKDTINQYSTTVVKDVPVNIYWSICT